jgi:hypothetical protein
MQAVYNWKIGKIEAKKSFTDKFGNVRENVIKSVELIFVGEKEDDKKEYTTNVSFNLIDLSDFKDASTLSKEEVLQWALVKINPKEKQYIEKIVKLQLNEEESKTLIIEL